MRPVIQPTLVAGALAIAVFVGGQTPSQAQLLDPGCVVNLLNYSVEVGSEGTWVLPPIPSQPGYYRIRALCPNAEGGFVRGMSELFTIPVAGPLSYGEISFDDYEAPPVRLIVGTDKEELVQVDETLNLNVMGELPDGFFNNLSTNLEGTWYASSNSDIAAVSPAGVVTAVSRGEATITVRHEGLISTVPIVVNIPNDDDMDTLPNEFEVNAGLNPNDSSDATLDLDGDNLINTDEFIAGTRPLVSDTDGDGVNDGDEAQNLGTNPVLPDTDGDDLIDGDEVVLGTDPLVSDTDGDGLSDGKEVELRLDPLVPTPTTQITGIAVDSVGSPLAAVAVVAQGGFVVTTDEAGFFAFGALPVGDGSDFALEAWSVGDGIVRAGRSTQLTPVEGAVVAAGDLIVAEVTEVIAGTVITPSGAPASGANIKILGRGVEKNVEALADGSFFAVGTPPGEYEVQLIDPSTGLRGQTFATVAEGEATTVSVILSPSGTVRGLVFEPTGAGRVGDSAVVQVTGPVSESVATDALSFYRFGYLPLGDYTVEASDAAGNRARATANLNSTNQVFPADLTYLGRGDVLGTVETVTGTKVVGATVALASQSLFGGTATTITGQQGEFAFEDVFIGPYTLTATDAVSGLSGFQAGLLLEHEAVALSTIVVSPSAELVGTVYAADAATPVAGATVKLLPSGLQTTTDAAGQYGIPGVPLGTYTVDVQHPPTSDRGRATALLALPDAQTNVDVVMNGVGTVTVSVVDAGGSPVPYSTLTVASGSFWGGTWSATADDAGVATVGPTLAGPLTVTASDPQKLRGGSTQSTLLPSEAATVTVALEASGAIAGTVFEPDGTTPAANVSVKLTPTNRSRTTGTDGTFRFDPAVVADGPYTLEAFDATGTKRATITGVAVLFQGQEVVQDLVMSGLGTVHGTVYAPDGSPASGAFVTLVSDAPNAPAQFGTATALGEFHFEQVPVGDVDLSASITANLWGGGASGSIDFDGDLLTIDIDLIENQLPPPPPSSGGGGGGGGTNPAFVSLLTRHDGNNFAYPIRQSGAIADGTQSLFQGDNGDARGAMKLEIDDGTGPELFVGSGGSVELGGRQVAIPGGHSSGLEITRRVYVPLDGYFARTVDTLSNPTGAPIVVDLHYHTDFRRRTAVVGGFTQTYGMAPVLTANGDAFYMSSGTDDWVTLDDLVDNDPFLQTGFQAVALVTSGPSASAPPSGTYDPNHGGEARARITQAYEAITLAPGEQVSVMHFVSQQVSRDAAQASAERLVQLPPEALEGLDAATVAEIVNFDAPADGLSALPALADRDGRIDGLVVEGDNTSAVFDATVRFRSNNPLFGRTWTYSTNTDGEFEANASFVDGNTLVVPREGFTVWATHPISGEESGPVGGGFLDPANPQTQVAVAFISTGWLTGTVVRSDGTVVSTGGVTISGEELLTPLDIPVALDGTFEAFGLPPGTYSVVATVPVPDGTDLIGAGSATIVAATETVTLITVEPTATLTGVVTDGGGAPAPNVDVSIVGPDGFGRSGTTTSGGVYTFIDIPLGAYDIIATEPFTGVPSLSNAVLDVDLGVFEADLQLIATAPLAVTATFDTGGPAGDATVQVQSDLLGTSFQSKGKTNAAGQRTVLHVPAGPFQVRVVNPDNSTLKGLASGAVANHGALIPVAVSVPADDPPSVAIVAPADGTAVAEGSTVTVTISAADDFGIKRVELLAGSTLVGTDKDAPYAIDLTALPPPGGGPLALVAIAVDTTNNTTTSVPVSLNLLADETPPVVALTAPADGVSVVEGAAVGLTATATDDVSVTSVSFRVDGALVGVDSAAPFEFTWTPDADAADAGPAPVVVEATAADAGGNETTDSIGLTIVDDQPPTIGLDTAPPEGASIIEGTSIALSAAATDDVGVVVQLVRDGAVIAVRNQAPFSFTTAVPGAVASGGTASYVLRAVDTQGQTAETPPRSIVIAADGPPSVSWLQPTDGATVTEGSTVSLAVAASDDVSLATVELRADGTPVALMASPPFSTTWTVPAGDDGSTIALEALATDSSGQTTTALLNATRADDTAGPTGVQIVAPAPGAVVTAGPSDVVLVIDTSGSTSTVAGGDANDDGQPDTILEAEIFAAKELLTLLDPASTRVAIVEFSDSAVLRRALTDDFALADTALDTMLLDGPAGGTNFNAAVKVGTDALIGNSARRQATPVQLLLSDGAAPTPAAEIARAVDGGVLVNTFAVGPEADAVGLEQIAQQTGGIFVDVPDPSALAALLPSLALFNADGVAAAAVASDDVGVTGVEFSLSADDDSFEGTASDPVAPYQAIFGVGPLAAPVDMTLEATATDAGGNSTDATPVSFTVLPADYTPVLLTVSPTSFAPGDLVTLTGRFFSPNSADNTVLFQGGSATALSSTKLSIVVLAPEGLEPGEVRVEVAASTQTLGGLLSNGLPYGADSDGDGLFNDEEVVLGTDPFLADSDFDLLADGIEVNTYATDPLDADTDDGGATDGFEVIYGLDPLAMADDTGDLDLDGLHNAAEEMAGTNPLDEDSDDDFLLDGAEVNIHGTDPLDADTDAGGLSDGGELTYGTDPLDPSDDSGDIDGDGLGNDEEAEIGTNPQLADTDGDDLTDGAEVNTHGTDPLLADTDGEGLDDGDEINTHGTNPLVADTDDDDIDDHDEIVLSLTNPLLPDTDSDNLSDGEEVNLYGTDPLLADSDLDGLNDDAELLVQLTDPNAADTDGDSFGDGDEVLVYSTNPLFADTCKVEVCDMGSCVLEQDPAPACCQLPNFAEDFGGGAHGLNLVNSNASSKWQVSASGESTSAPWALYYGNPAQGNFANGDTSGTASTPLVYVPDRDENELVFDVWMDTQTTTSKDKLTVSVVGLDDVKSVVWTKSDYLALTPMGYWQSHRIDLDAWRGDTVRLEFAFDTVDGSSNGGEGVYLDGIAVTASCPASTCSADADCSDSDLCTTESCGGEIGCLYPAIVCDDDNACTDDSCESASGCVATPHTTACDDGDACTVGENCGGGTCDGGSALPCDDGNDCTSDSCDPTSGCVFAPLVGACDDGNACTENDACASGTCTGTATDCDDGDACTTDGCATSTGCTTTPLLCNDGNPCTDDACDSASGCTTTPNTASCSDGDACTLDDICAGGSCAAGPAISCDDGNPCNGLEFCSPASGCTVPASGQPGGPDPCDDGDACTTDTCNPVGGACSYSAVECDDANACTEDYCDPASGCQHDPADCDDGDACTIDGCSPASGCTTGTVVCDDANPCTTDSCIPASGCTATPDDAASCSDDDACTENDACGAGTCSGTPIDCTDAVPCTIDTCDPATGCAPTADDAACDDGVDCTLDVCDLLADCSNTPDDAACDDGHDCTTDSCDAAADCQHSGSDAACDDGNDCTADTCDVSQGCVYDGAGATLEWDPAQGDGQAEWDALWSPLYLDVTYPFAYSSGGIHITDDLQQGLVYSVETVIPADLTGTTLEWQFEVFSFEHSGIWLFWEAVDGSLINIVCNDYDVSTGVYAAEELAQVPYTCPEPIVDTGFLTSSATPPAQPLKKLRLVILMDSVIDGDYLEIERLALDGIPSCDDGDVCTQFDLCQGGVCTGTTPQDCEDGTTCTDNDCDAVAGCLYTPLAGSCDDGDICTLSDACTGGQCLPAIADPTPPTGPLYWNAQTGTDGQPEWEALWTPVFDTLTSDFAPVYTATYVEFTEEFTPYGDGVHYVLPLPERTLGATFDYLIDGISMEESGMWLWWEDDQGALHNLECFNDGLAGTSASQIPYPCANNAIDFTWNDTVTVPVGAKPVALHLLIGLTASLGDFVRVYRVGATDVTIADQTDCSDAVVCTVDACHPTDGCSNTADDSLCPLAHFCTTDPADSPDANGCAPKPVAASCLEHLALNPGAASGLYFIDPDDGGPIVAFETQCDMDTGTGGWTELTLENTALNFGATLSFTDEASIGTVDGNHRPVTQDGSGDHSYRYDISVPFGFQEFRLVNYVAKANGSSSTQTSEIDTNVFIQSTWGQAFGSTWGDISFGTPANGGPTTSYAAQGEVEMCSSCTLPWPGSPGPYDTGSVSTTLRLEWGEAGSQLEGWYPWWTGSIWVR